MMISAEPMSGGKVSARGLRAVEIALILSLALNLFVLVGVGWAVLHPPPPPPFGIGPKFDRLAQDLNAAGPVGDLHRDLAAVMRGIRQQNAQQVGALLSELRQPKLDEAKVQALLNDIASRRQAAVGVTPALMRFFIALTPEQRTTLAGLLSSPRREEGQPVRGLIGN